MRSLTLASFILASLLAVPALAAPKLKVAQPIRDFGTVAKGDVLTAVFEIENAGDTPLEILAVKPACGCTAADFDKLILPGKTGKVTAKVETASFAGPISKGITIETNDAGATSMQLAVTAIVKPYVEAYPAGFVRFNLLRGAVESQSVTLYSEETEPFSIVSVEPPADWIAVKHRKLDAAERVPRIGRDGSDQHRIEVTVDSTKRKPGPLAEKVRIVTSSKKQPEYWISVSGVIRPPYRVEPTAVSFGEVAPHDVAATRTITVRSNDLKSPASFSVKKVVSTAPAVTATLAPTANSGEYEVTLQIARGAAPGAFKGEIQIETSSTAMPSFTIPIAGTVRAAK